MRNGAFGILAILLATGLDNIPAYSQQPTGKIASVKTNQNSVCLTYDLSGSTEKKYEVVLYLQRENDPFSLRKLEKVEGDVGEGNYAGSGRTICWDRNEITNPIVGARYQFVLEFREAKGGGLPWYLYAGAAVVGTAVYFAVSPGKSQEKAEPKSIPLPPPR
jgi:hypothetical protein